MNIYKLVGDNNVVYYNADSTSQAIEMFRAEFGFVPSAVRMVG